MGAVSLINICWVWFAEGLSRAELHHGQGCTWRYSATLHWRSYSPACVLLGQKEKPTLLACPASYFLKSSGCCSANDSCTAGSRESFKQRRNRSIIPQLRGEEFTKDVAQTLQNCVTSFLLQEVPPLIRFFTNH